tara:strand:+ start:1619 stop:2065 length:447 start_codon:yes stop_codon:yes gene_type:complete
MIAKCESPVTDNKEQALEVASLNKEALLALLDVVSHMAFKKYPNNGSWMVNFNYRYAYVYEMLEPDAFNDYETIFSTYSVGIDIVAKAVADTAHKTEDIVEAYMRAHECGVEAVRKSHPFRSEWSLSFSELVQNEFEDYLESVDLIGE